MGTHCSRCLSREQLITELRTFCAFWIRFLLTIRLFSRKKPASERNRDHAYLENGRNNLNALLDKVRLSVGCLFCSVIGHPPRPFSPGPPKMWISGGVCDISRFRERVDYDGCFLSLRGGQISEVHPLRKQYLNTRPEVSPSVFLLFGRRDAKDCVSLKSGRWAQGSHAIDGYITHVAGSVLRRMSNLRSKKAKLAFVRSLDTKQLHPHVSLGPQVRMRTDLSLGNDQERVDQFLKDSQAQSLYVAVTLMMRQCGWSWNGKPRLDCPFSRFFQFAVKTCDWSTSKGVSRAKDRVKGWIATALPHLILSNNIAAKSGKIAITWPPVPTTVLEFLALPAEKEYQPHLRSRGAYRRYVCMTLCHYSQPFLTSVLRSDGRKSELLSMRTRSARKLLHSSKPGTQSGRTCRSNVMAKPCTRDCLKSYGGPLLK